MSFTGGGRRHSFAPRRHPAVRVGALLLVLGLVAAGCTDGGEAPTEPGDAGGSPATVPTEQRDPSPTATGLFAPGARVLEVAVGEISTLDPMRIQDPGSVLVARQLYESLTAWDPVAQEVVPGVAERWTSSNGGRTFTFRLYQGMTYHDGSPVTADDFVFAFNRIARKRSGSELAYTLERISGFDEVNVDATSRELRGVRARDDLTLVIDLDEPFRDLPALLTHPGLVPLKRRSVRDLDTFLTQPVGNGPFQMAQAWSPEEPVVLRRFDGFVQTPQLDGIRFSPFSDAAASWLQFVEGEFDVAEVPAGQTEAAAQTFGDRGFQPFLAGYYLGANLRVEPLQSLRLRRAISRAIDRESIAERIYRGTLRPARGIVPHGMPGFQENVCVPICAYDRDTATRLVSELPRRRRRVTIEFTSGPPHRRVVNSIRRDLEAVGLEVTTRAVPLGRYLRRLRDGRQQLYRLGWIAEYPVPDVFLSDLFRSDAPDNHSGFSSARVDRLLDRARRTTSEGSRTQLYLEAEKQILRELPVIPIGSFVTHWVAQERVREISFDAMGGFDALGVTMVDGSDDESDG